MTKDSDEGIALESSALETLYGDKFTYAQRTRAAYLFLITLHQGGGGFFPDLNLFKTLLANV